MVTYAGPRTSDELEEFLNDPKRVQTAFSDPATAKEFIERYAAKAGGHDPELAEQQKQQQRQILAELLEEKGVALKGNRGRVSMAGAVPTHPQAPGAELNGRWGHLGAFLHDAWYRTIEDRGGPSDDIRRSKVLGEGQGDQGGFLVPEEFRAELLQTSLETAIVRPRATVIPMTRQTMTMPSIRDVSHATTVFGGIQMYWTPEAAAPTQTDPTFAQVRLDAKKLVGSTRVNNELLEDSAFSLEGLLSTLYPAAIAYFEDDAFIAGIGGGQPIGIKNANALVSVAKETGQAATTFVWENAIKMFARLLPQSMGRAVWVAHMNTIPQLAVMSLSVGTGGSAVWAPNGAGGLPTTLLGRPILYSEKCETLGTAGDVYLADFSQYLIGDRMSMEVASSMHSRFLNDQTEFRITSRLDGKPWLDSALTPRNGTTTLSAYLTVAARA